MFVICLLVLKFLCQDEHLTLTTHKNHLIFKTFHVVILGDPA